MRASSLITRVALPPRTPSPAAEQGDIDDTTSGDRVATPVALLIVLAMYAAFFGRSIIRSLQVQGGTMPLDDYGSPEFIAMTGRWAGEIALAVAVLVVVRSFVLRIGWPLTGVPNRGASSWPALLTVMVAAAGMLLAGAIKALLDGGTTAFSGTVGNPWAVFGVLRAVNAGVVEEITIVALPVLLLRRAGWHPAGILALSVAMRWPFHIYHGLWSSLPWAAIWGGAFCLAFMYLRRLLPLVVFHTLFDTVLITTAAWGIFAAAVSLSAAGAALLWLINRRLRERTHRLDAQSRRSTVSTAWYLFRHVGVLPFAVFFVIAIPLLLTIGVQSLPDNPDDAVIVCGAAVFMMCAAWALFIAKIWRVAVDVRRDERGRIAGAVTWYARTRPGQIRIAHSINTDVFDAIRIVAENEPSATTIALAVTRNGTDRFAAAGYHHTRQPGSLNKLISIPRSDALTIGGTC